MRLLFFAIVLTLMPCAAAQTPAPDRAGVYDFDAVDSLPRLQDGRALREAFAPDYGDRQQVCLHYTGSIYLTFIVTAEGDVRSVQLLTGMDYCAKFLVEAVEALGPWMPGEVGGKPVATRMYLHYYQAIW